MLLSRRMFLASSLLGLSGCAVTPPTDEADRIADAKAKAIRYLLSRQASDGAWKSDVYGTFKDGTALTPLVLNAILAAGADQQKAIDSALSFLSLFVKANSIDPPDYGFDFALYTSALSVTALGHPACAKHENERETWLAYLKKRQLTQKLGWHPDDREFGGWGYSRGVPHKPKRGELIPPLTESNLSATTFALEAMHAAKVPKDDPLWKNALVFVHRCQNWTNADTRDPKYDDGGFYFIYDDPVRNKAGLATPIDRAENVHYRSYGSTTCDGLRCLIYADTPKTDPRRRAAEAWLRYHFSATRHPGDYAKMRQLDREAVYFYFASSFAKTPLGSEQPFREKLTEALLAKQSREGSWQNPTHAVREDDPLVATSFALSALSRCVPLSK